MTEIIEVKNMQYVGEQVYTIDGEKKCLGMMTLVDLDVTRWNSLAERTNAQSFIKAFGRLPANHSEVKEWVNSFIQGIEKAPAATGANSVHTYA